jgi:hypothetical protein
LPKKDVNIEVLKPNKMGINERDGKTCPRMTAGKDLEYKCMSHGNIKNITCSSIDYYLHILEINMCLLSNPA